MNEISEVDNLLKIFRNQEPLECWKTPMKSLSLFIALRGGKLSSATAQFSAALFSEDPEVLLVDKCPPEELHCLQGFVNHTFY